MIVGFIGIGTLGWPMAANVFRAGHDLVVYDSAAGRAEHFNAEVGGRAAVTLADLAGAEFIVTSLPNGDVVRDVYMAGGLAALLAPGTVLIDMSSADPSGTAMLASELAAMDLVLIDGHDAAASHRAQPLLSVLGKQLFEIGTRQ